LVWSIAFEAGLVFVMATSPQLWLLSLRKYRGFTGLNLSPTHRAGEAVGAPYDVKVILEFVADVDPA
jgi:hypothetical protein